MQREAVHDRGHAELTHAVVEVVAAARCASTAREPDHSVRLEPARSAEPPISSGRIGRECPRSLPATPCASRCSPPLSRAVSVSARTRVGEIRRQLTSHASLELARLTRIRTRVLAKALDATTARAAAAAAARIPHLIYMRRNLERRVVPSDGGSRRRDFLVAERRAVRVMRARLVGRALGDDCLAADQRGPVRRRPLPRGSRDRLLRLS